MKAEEIKYRGLAVIVRNENDYKQLQKFLGQYLYIDWVPQMATTETSVVIYFDDENFMSIGSVGSTEYQKESNIRTIEFSEFFTTTQPQPKMSAEEIINNLLKDWGNAIVNLNRNNGMFKFDNVRLRHCSLHYSETVNEYYIKYKDVTFGLFDICEYRNQPIEIIAPPASYKEEPIISIKVSAPFTPLRSEQEEADRWFKLMGGRPEAFNTFESIVDYFKSRGLSTTFEEKVLTILKGK